MSEETSIERAQRRVQLLLTSIKANMHIMWPGLTSYVQAKFKALNTQDWRDFAQTILESTYEEYQALDGYYLPPDEVHVLQEELDKFAETFPPWFKENFNGEAEKENPSSE